MKANQRSQFRRLWADRNKEESILTLPASFVRMSKALNFKMVSQPIQELPILGGLASAKTSAAVFAVTFFFCRIWDLL